MQMRRFAAGVLALLLPSVSAVAQPGVIAGTAYDSLHAAPLRRPSTANDRGEIRLSGVTPGTQSVEVPGEVSVAPYGAIFIWTR